MGFCEQELHPFGDVTRNSERTAQWGQAQGPLSLLTVNYDKGGGDVDLEDGRLFGLYRRREAAVVYTGTGCCPQCLCVSCEVGTEVPSAYLCVSCEVRTEVPTQCIYVFRTVLTINSDCFPTQH
jgi:hypothetical protein